MPPTLGVFKPWMSIVGDIPPHKENVGMFYVIFIVKEPSEREHI